LYIYLFQLYLR